MQYAPIPQLGADGKIVEGLVTTLNADQTPHLAPLGPIVDPQFQQFVLRPYQTSTTYRNLKRSGVGVFHVTDDVALIAQAALGTPQPLPEMVPAPGLAGNILTTACRWYALKIQRLEDSQPRAHLDAHCVAQGRLRDFIGFNRAQHAVLEAAILATRIQFLDAEEILASLQRLAIPVVKTASLQEQQTFDGLCRYIQARVGSRAQGASTS